MMNYVTDSKFGVVSKTHTYSIEEALHASTKRKPEIILHICEQDGEQYGMYFKEVYNRIEETPVITQQDIRNFLKLGIELPTTTYRYEFGGFDTRPTFVKKYNGTNTWVENTDHAFEYLMFIRHHLKYPDEYEFTNENVINGHTKLQEQAGRITTPVFPVHSAPRKTHQDARLVEFLISKSDTFETVEQAEDFQKWVKTAYPKAVTMRTGLKVVLL